MDVGHFVESYGYWALAVGCFLEGETLLALAGFAAHQGHLDFVGVVMVASTAASAGDQFWFLLGRRYGARLLEQFPGLAAEAPRFRIVMLRFDAWLIVGLRFAYGLRLAGPLIFGTTSIRASRLMLFNTLGAVIWSLLVASLGWLFGHLIESALGKLQAFESMALASLAALLLLLWGLRHWRHRHRVA